MSGKNPLGPVERPKEAVQNDQDVAARMEAAHAARNQAPARHTQRSVLGMLALIIVAGICGYVLYYLKHREPRTIEPITLEEIQTVPKGYIVQGDLSAVMPYTDKMPVVLFVEDMPTELELGLQKQSLLFRDLVFAALLEKPNTPVASQESQSQLSNYPPMVYFTRPKAGQYVLGYQDKLVQEFGTSNVFSMSSSLWSNGREMIEAYTRGENGVTLESIQAFIDKEYQERDPSSSFNKQQDDMNRAKDHADVAWLKSFKNYVQGFGNLLSTESKDVAWKPTVNFTDARMAWQAFLDTEGKGLGSGMSEVIVSQVAVGPVHEFSCENGQDAVVALTIRNQPVFLLPSELPMWFKIKPLN